MDRFVNLHRHDCYSFFDGLDMAIRAADKAKQMEQPALGLTNHGNIYGLIDHYRLCNDRGIKPILGCEMYVTEGEAKPEKEDPHTLLCHQTVLVENQVGYRNLMRLITLGNSEELFFRKPRVPIKALAEHKEGLIVLSGCPGSLLARTLENFGSDPFSQLFAWMAGEFKDQFYGEIQHHEKSTEYYRAIRLMCARHGVPIVATTDSHYVDKEDRPVHDLLLSLRYKGKEKGEENPTYGDGYHMVSRNEMAERLMAANQWMDGKDVTRALDETVEIANRVDFSPQKPSRMLPALWKDSAPRLRALALKGMERRGLEGKEYDERIEKELGVIEKMGYTEYFHICHEVTSWARSSGILIGPRGSVCGSLLAYVLGVTAVNPLVHGTLFERFLHDQKKALPDVDLDIDSRYRDQVLDYVIKKYAPYAIPIVTFGRMGGGNIARDLLEAYKDILSEEEANKIRFTLDDIKLHKCFVITGDVLDRYPIFDILEEKIPGIKRVCMKLYNMTYYVGQHPGGVCFVPDDHTNWIAKVRVRDKWMTSYNYQDCERLGLLKFDFLGLAAMSTISEASRLVKDRHGVEVDADNIPLDDSSVLTQFAKARTDSIFQFETRGARQILSQIEPDSFAEVAVSTALNRPGVSAQVERYVKGKATRYRKGFFADTYGAPVYQEQIMKMLLSLGFEMRECDDFVKSMKNNSYTYALTLEEEHGKPIFVKLIKILVGMGKDEEKVKRMVSEITQYAFNKAHAIGYALVAYWMMWLREHYPLEYWAALLNSESFDAKRHVYEGCAVRSGCILLPPHVNGSVRYTIEGNGIRVGLMTIKNVGEKAATEIVEKGPYEMPSDVGKLSRRLVNARVIRALVEAGALEMHPDKWKRLAIEYNQKRMDMSAAMLYSRKTFGSIIKEGLQE